MDFLLFVLLIFTFQVVVFWFVLGITWIPLILFGVAFGALLGIIVYVGYTELNLCLEDLTKVDVAGKSVLVTGCDSGFGLMLAKSLATRGLFVFACVLDLKSDGAETLMSLPSTKVIKMNVISDEEVDEAVCLVKEHVSETGTKLWAIVNNAGIGNSKLLEFTSLDKVRQLFEINSLGMLRVCQRFAPLLRKHGRIVNVTSVAGFHVSPFLGAYCASKFAAEAISKSLRIEMHSLGIPVITIQPNSYRTPILYSSINDIYGTDEITVYGEKFMLESHETIKNWALTSSTNFQEVIHVMESALLNKSFQYNYIPNMKARLSVIFLKFLTEKRLVTTGCRDTELFIPTNTD